jgi:hypothetical protein
MERLNYLWNSIQDTVKYTSHWNCNFQISGVFEREYSKLILDICKFPLQNELGTLFDEVENFYLGLAKP